MTCYGEGCTAHCRAGPFQGGRKGGGKEQAYQPQERVRDDVSACPDQRGIPDLFLFFVNRLAVLPQTDNFHCHHGKNNFLGVP